MNLYTKHDYPVSVPLETALQPKEPLLLVKATSRALLIYADREPCHVTVRREEPLQSAPIYAEGTTTGKVQQHASFMQRGTLPGLSYAASSL